MTCTPAPKFTSAPWSVPRPAGTTFINAHFSNGRIGSLRTWNSRIAALDERPHPQDVVVDLQGDRLLPGLINAHDHLQLNSLGTTASTPHYRHAREWVSDINARRRSDPSFEASIAVARDARLLIGGIKNLLSGVTTVAHHDPHYASLSAPHFPVGVVQDYGWAHSLYIEGDDQVRHSYRQTPANWPWIIHAAEGVDEEAHQEFDRLDALGCIQPNTLLAHGVALDARQRMRLKDTGTGLLWCPSSNLALFGQTAEIADLLGPGCAALGSDSRLSGARDLLEELELVRRLGGFDESCLESLVTSNSAKLLRLPDRGALVVGARADLLVLPARTGLGSVARADVRLVVVGGSIRHGDEDYIRAAASDCSWARVRVDGREKLLDRRLALALTEAGVHEDGLEFSTASSRAA